MRSWLLCVTFLGYVLNAQPTSVATATAAAEVKAAEIARDRAALARDKAQLEVRVADEATKQAAASALAIREKELNRAEVNLEKAKLALREAEIDEKEAQLKKTSPEAVKSAELIPSPPKPPTPPAPRSMSLSEALDAAQKGDPEAEYALGKLYDEGVQVTRNVPVAIEWLTRAASHNNFPAAILLASRYLEREPGYYKRADKAEREAKAQQLLAPAAEAKDARAMYWLSKIEGHANLLEESAQLGDPLAQWDLAARIRNSKNPPPDVVRADALKQRALESGDPSVWLKMGSSLEYGEKEDKAAALSWYRKAADAGSAKGVTSVAQILRFNKELAESSQWPAWAEKAVAMGDVEALRIFGMDLVDGTLTLTSGGNSQQEGVRRMTRAFLQGDASAGSQLGEQLIVGEYLTTDPRRGINLMEQSYLLAPSQIFFYYVVGPKEIRDIERGLKLCGEVAQQAGLKDADCSHAFFDFSFEFPDYLERRGLAVPSKDKQELVELARTVFKSKDRKAAQELGQRIDKLKVRKPYTGRATDWGGIIQSTIDGMKEGLNQGLATLPQR